MNYYNSNNFTNITIKVANQIKSLRRGKGLSQKDIADHLGITAQQVTNYELGKSSLTIERFVEICTILVVNPIVLLEKCYRTNNNIENNAIDTSSISEKDVCNFKKFISILQDFTKYNESKMELE
jgi:transcriptional regulator with XRE-family HTH domain